MSMPTLQTHALATAPRLMMSRLGFHYYNDTQHYRMSDLHAWLPELQAMGASWLTLIAPSERAIPEPFLRGLLDAGIEPILHFPFSAGSRPSLQSFQVLANVYAGWGIHYVALFDRPNRRAAWQGSGWSQSDLVERFLDLYLPLANLCLQAGISPVFSPLEPGGDYWDTAFLQGALRGMLRRNQRQLLDALVLSAYGLVGDQRLDWGAGGPERWPSARPYMTPRGQEDQRGFFIFDWYNTICQAVLGRALPIVLLRAGSLLKGSASEPATEIDEITHAQKNLAIARLMCGDRLHLYGQQIYGTLPTEVLACNFWPLAAAAEDPHAAQAWYRADGSTLPIIGALRQWMAERGQPERGSQNVGPLSMFEPSHSDTRPVVHYLLLPLSDWGIAEPYLEIARPYIQQLHPSVGFSIEEAAQAAHVMVVGDEQAFSDGVVHELQNAGCIVERITSIGTNLATHSNDDQSI